MTRAYYHALGGGANMGVSMEQVGVSKVTAGAWSMTPHDTRVTEGATYRLRVSQGAVGWPQEGEGVL